MQNSKNTCNSGLRQPLSSREMRKLALDFSHGSFGMGKALRAFAQEIVQLLKSPAFFTAARSAPFLGFSHLRSDTQHTRSRSDLLPMVPAVMHQGLGNQHKPTRSRQQKRYPGIVELIRRNRKHRVESIPAKGKRRAGDDRMVAQNFQSPAAQEFCLTGIIQPEALPKTQTHGSRIIVDHFGVAESRDDIARIAKGGFEPSQFMWVPHVILIGQGDDTPLAARNALFEIPGRAEIFRVDLNAHGERTSFGELPQNFERSVRGSVIAHNEFVRQAVLPGNALELRNEERFPIECTHRNRDGERHHFGKIATLDMHSGASSLYPPTALSARETCLA